MDKYALLSVTDKTDIAWFAGQLQELGFILLSTGGTAAALRKADLEVLDVSEITDLPELFDGRVKTLHPKIHGGILYERDSSIHQEQQLRHNIPKIDIVVVNLYDFASAKNKGMDLDHLIHEIDIGGPGMLRAAAKNHKFCLPVCDPTDYRRIAGALRAGGPDLVLRREMAAKVFRQTCQYDAMISESFALATGSAMNLRYGENPHQSALVDFDSSPKRGLAAAQVLSGKELSYNNILDLDAGLRLIAEFPTIPALAILKHTNPCGFSAKPAGKFEELYKNALSSNPKAAFGGILVSNCPLLWVDQVRELDQLFFECLLVPELSQEVQDFLGQKKNRRLLKLPRLEDWRASSGEREVRSIVGGKLKQSMDVALPLELSSWKTVTKRQFEAIESDAMEAAWKLVKHQKSNAIALWKDHKLIGAGSGQTSRIDALQQAISQARDFGHDMKDAILASDAFFPFSDIVEMGAQAGIRTFVQPGGSVKDEESIAMANQLGVVMVFTGTRHFRH
jgi:phosphoribosylaminoimidazolecarboxamide formyltransferase/IMP cyclohydrolase